jgi:hypothetical protein
MRYHLGPAALGKSMTHPGKVWSRPWRWPQLVRASLQDLRHRSDATGAAAASWVGALLFMTIATAPGLASDRLTPQDRRVYAHYMLSFPTYGITSRAYDREVRDAIEIGLDGFVVDVTEWSAASPEVRKRLDTLFDSTWRVAPGFRIAVLADMCCSLTAQDVAELLKRYSGKPNYLLFDGRPVLATFLGQKQGAAFWKRALQMDSANGAASPFFIPFFYAAGECAYEDRQCGSFNIPSRASIRAVYGSDRGVPIAGLHYFATAGLVGDLIKAGNAYAGVAHEMGVPYFAGVAPYFWLGRIHDSGSTPLRRYYETRGGEGIEAQWRAIILQQRPAAVFVCTFNDYTESYMTGAAPHDMPLKQYFFNVGPLLLDHSGYAELFRFFIAWYKSGEQPAIRENKLFAFYRTHPSQARATGDLDNVVQYGNPEDTIYLTVMAKSAGALQVRSGDHIETIAVAPGLHHYRAPFRPGAQSFRLTLANDVVTLEGSPIQDDVVTKYNLTTYAGVSRGY